MSTPASCRLAPPWAALACVLLACDPRPPPPPASTGEAVYAVAYDVNSPDGSWTGYLGLHGTLALGTVDTTSAMELSGNPMVVAAQGAVFVGSDERKAFTRYELEEGRLVARGTVSFINEGMPFLYRPDVVSPTQAFSYNRSTYELLEWNPSTMTITRRHDLSGLKREDFAMEWRSSDEPMYREADGLLFYYVSYNNKRSTYANALHVVVFNTRDGTWKLLKDSRCGESAGFGGWVAESGDVYLFSDNFGALAEIIGGIKRPSCLLRVKAGQQDIDPEYLLDLNALLGGRHAWGLYYAGGGKAYTTALDMSRQGEFDTAYNFLFARIHPFYRIDVEARTVAEVTTMEPSGVGWNPFQVDGQLYVPRTTGRFSKVGNMETAESAVYAMQAEANVAVEQFRVPGTPSLMVRLR